MNNSKNLFRSIEPYNMSVKLKSLKTIMYKKLRVEIVILLSFLRESIGQLSPDCRDRSNTLRQDGSMCFELPAWQYKPVELDKHIEGLTDRWQIDLKSSRAGNSRVLTPLVSNEVNRYMDTVLFPFLDTYHKNIQHSYQQFTLKILKKIKEEINLAVHRKQQIYEELMTLADDLKIPELCDEERRQARTLASKHVALIYTCTEEARKAITKMGKYAEQMISITKNHMQMTVDNTTLNMETGVQSSQQQTNSTLYIQELSNSAVKLGYELDLSLTNARRHNEQSCEKLSSCCVRSKKVSEDGVLELKKEFQQCVYA